MYRKNVAGQHLPFVMIAAADGSALTGATVTGQRSIDGGAQGAVTGTISELGDGQYNLALSQADTNGNNIGVLFTAAGAIPAHFTLVLTAADPTDAANFGLTNLDAAVTTRSSHSAADVWTSGTRTLTSFGTLAVDTATAVWAAGTRTLTGFGTLVADIWAAVVDSAGVTTLLSRLTAGRATNLDNLDATVSSRLATAGYTAPPTAGANADAVWDELLAGHAIVGSTGAALSAAGSAGDPWATVLPGAYGAGTAGFLVGTNLDAAVSTRSSHSAAAVWAVVARTITGGTITTVSDKTGYSLAVAPPTAAAIATEIINTTLAEIAQGIPPATPTVGEALMAPWMELTNETTTDASWKKVRNRLGTVIYKSPLSDDTVTFSKGVAQSGP